MPENVAYRIQPGARIETPLCRLAQSLATSRSWRRYGLAFLFGVIAVGALPPVDLTPLVFLAFPGLLWLDDGSAGPWASFRLGWAFGFGFFLAGLYWIADALFVDIARFWWLVPFAAAGLPALLAVYSGLALGSTSLTVRWLRLPATARIFAFAILWTASEWARGHAFTGFPWNLIGYVWSGGFPGAETVLQSVAWVGIYGLSLITVLAASLPALLGAASLRPLYPARRAMPAIGAALLVLVPGIAGAVRLAASPPHATDIWLRLVQPSIPESLKWDPAAARRNFDRLLALSREPAHHPIAAVLWPEAATPYFLARDAAARRDIAAVAPKEGAKRGYVITGTLRANPPPGRIETLWNSIEAINAKSAIVARYDKVHLVPFGEYVPFRRYLPIRKITPGMIDLTPGKRPQTIELPGLPPFAPLVCYEVIFPGTGIRQKPRPDWILNVTNDAWYGRSSGPFQHFEIARTRAIAEDLPLVRVANNGISGVVDRVGRVVTRMDLDAIGYADVRLPQAGPPTLYARFGDWMLIALLALTAIPVGLRLH